MKVYDVTRGSYSMKLYEAFTESYKMKVYNAISDESTMKVSYMGEIVITEYINSIIFIL